MTDVDGIEPVDILPDRLSVAEFSSTEMETILGESADEEQARDNFNWVGAYLVEQAQLTEVDVAEWFKSGARGLRGKRPLDVWQKMDGFLHVFEYARVFKEKVDEALADEPPAHNEELLRSHDIAFSALDTIFRSFKAANVELPNGKSEGMISRAIHNPAKQTAPTLRWKGNGELEDYRITRKEGDYTSMYYIVRYVGDDVPPFIMQSGVVETRKGKQIITESDSDLDGRPPSAGEVASFIIPLAQETKNKTLALISR